MNKTLKLVLAIVIPITVFLVGIGTFVVFMVINAANAEEYKLGDDSIRSITSVVGKRKATSVSTSIKNGVTTKKTTYSAEGTVNQDLTTYVQYLRNEGGFALTKDVDLSAPSSIIELGKPSKDSGNLLVITILYTPFEYTVTIQKGAGQLTYY